MRARLIRGLHHARRGLFYTGAIALILIALAVALADRLLPLVQQNPDRIAAWLIARSGRPVHFDHAEAHWTNRGPLFTLHDLRIGAGKDQLRVDRAELLVAMYSGVLPGRPFTELRLHGLTVTVERDAGGRWRLVGLGAPQRTPSHDPLASLQDLGELQIADARLTVRVPSRGLTFTTPKVALRMRVSADRVRAGVRVDGVGGKPLTAVLDFDRRRDDGSLWVGSDGLDLAPWSELLAWSGARLESGRGRLQAWIGIHDARMESVQVEAALHDVAFVADAALPRPGLPAMRPRVDLASLAVSARLRKTAAGAWEFVAPRLRLRGSAGGEDRLDGLALQVAAGGGVRLALAAPRIELGAMLAIAMLDAQLPPGLRAWLLQASPRVVLSQVQVATDADGRLHGSAHVDDAGWQPVGERPAIQGLAGSVLFDADAITFNFDKPDPVARPLHLLWPPAYGDPVGLAIDGHLTAWRDDGDWVLDSSDLHARNDQIDLATRIVMRLHGDGRKPRLDLFATVQPARMVDAKRYWLRHRMHPTTVQWLDDAIEGGQVAGAHVLLGGDLTDWPFKNDQGRFEAVADLVDGQLHFRPDWPRAEHVTGQLSFIDAGMQFEGSASIVGIDVPRLRADIPWFHEPVLAIRADAIASGPQLLALLRQSPLRNKDGSGFAALDIRGQNLRGTMQLTLPLKHELGAPTVAGDVDLAHAALTDKRWNVSMTDVAGRVHYDQTGVLADALQVKIDGEPAQFRLAIGKPAGDPALAVAATLTGNLPAATLLARAPMLAWLDPIISGRSLWTVEVKIPEAAIKGSRVASTLVVRSDLRGATLKLPAPLDKAPGAALPLQVSAPLPASAGDIAVALGDVLHVRGRYDDGKAFRALLALGRAANGAALPAHGLVVSGRADRLDAAGWVGFALGSSGMPGAGGLQSVDVQADKLMLGGRPFAATRLRMDRQADAIALRLDGPAIVGAITVPGDLARGIRARFDRLYWPGATPAVDAGATSAADTDVDPAGVPPLQLEVADLRLGDARLGSLTLQTHPIAQGLRIDQLDAVARTQKVTAVGDWTRINGKATRTRLSMEFRADSLGHMLDAFGFKGVVAAGKTHASLQASWAGSPAAFALAALDGSLDIDVGEGRLLEVKPGAGRILGLVSLAELPRRLTLDFRDFFDKGFAFDTLRGRFTFNHGMAHTDDLAIKGPAANIHVRGDADLVGKQYDQTIDVLPKPGGLVTAVGAAVAGPVGAAVGAVAGQVLSHPLQQMAHKRYHVTGPWAQPQVKANAVGGAEAAPEPLPQTPHEDGPR